MRTFRTTSGPFGERPYYTIDEIEQLCAEELDGVDMYPAAPGSVRIERFIEKRFGIHPIYDDLPTGVLGFTKFGCKGVEAILVSRALSEQGDKVSERRLSTTLAHEAGHGLLHAHLFVSGAADKSLFDDDALEDPTRILCRDDGVPGITEKRQGYDGRWWEYQANRAMGALLLPRRLVNECLQGVLVARGSFGRKGLPQGQRETAARLISDVFDVNPVVARIRIADLYPIGDERQLTL